MATHPKIEIDPQAETMALVKQAQAAYAAGQDREWSGVLWMAGERAVRELAQSRGIACLRPPKAIRHSEFRNHRSEDIETVPHCPAPARRNHAPTPTPARGANPGGPRPLPTGMAKSHRARCSNHLKRNAAAQPAAMASPYRPIPAIGNRCPANP